MSRLQFALIVACVCFSSCRGTPHRPAGVPPSAVFVDNAFIDCTAESQTRTDNCTVYRADDGQILIKGTFVRNAFVDFASVSELHYLAYGDWAIFLQDGTKLVPTESTIWNQLVNERLRPLTGDRPENAVDCTKAAVPLACALEQFKMLKPFYVIYRTQGVDSYGFAGFAADTEGNLFNVEFDSMGWWQKGLPPGARMFDARHTIVLPCPKPTILEQGPFGGLTCLPTTSH